jgi:hypothetical protein
MGVSLASLGAPPTVGSGEGTAEIRLIKIEVLRG